MQPSSAGSGTGSERGSNLRRYGPIVAIVVVIAIVGAVVLLSGGDDDKKPTSTGGSGSSSSSGAVALPTGAIPFSQKGNRTDLTFMDTCDLETGRLKMPYFYAPECFANVADNGGATAPGVTKDTITVVVYLAPDTDPIIDFITAPIKNDDTADTDQATYEGYTAMFNEYFQTYGRKVELKFLHGSGTSDNEVQARADAVKAVEELGAFAVWGGPILAPAWTEEIKARGVICLGCPDIPDPSPVVFPITPSTEQTNLQVAEYVSKKLNNKSAAFAGDDAFKTKTRTFGHVYQNSPGSGAEQDAAALKQALSEGGVTLTEQISYSLADLVNSPEVATNVVSKLKASGVTTVLLQPDPIAPKSFTEEATKQNYFPEWVDAAGTLIDTAAFGRTYDQKQWAHMFGISFLAARVKQEVSDRFDLYTWYTGQKAPSEGSGVLFPRPGLFFAGLQAAGPNLTAETFRQGLFFGAPSDARSVTAPGITYGDHGLYPGGDDYYGIDDFVEVWWDPSATGPDEVDKQGTGLIQFVDGGKRYRLGEWTSDLKVFDTNGAVSLYDDIPAAEKPKEYPSPKANAN